MSRATLSRLSFGACVFAGIVLFSFAVAYALTSEVDPRSWPILVQDVCIGGGLCCALFFGIVTGCMYEPTPANR